MVKLKTLLDTRRSKSDGTFNILFRITNYKEVKYIPLGISVIESQWEEKSATINKSHPNANTLNTLISKRFYEIQKALVSIEESYSFDRLKEILYPKPVEEPEVTTFKQFSQSVIDSMIKVKRTGGALVYLTAVNRLIDHCDNPNIRFDEINYTFLDGFNNKLIEQGLSLLLRNSPCGIHVQSIQNLHNLYKV